jgi:hypothetical protein
VEDPPVRPTRLQTKTFGYVATGPGFYVWYEHRGEAQRAARDLTAPSAAPPTAVPARPGLRPGRRPS